MEGFIGYITREQGLALFQLLYAMSDPGSLLIGTAPPSRADFDDAKQNGIALHHTTYEEVDQTVARWGQYVTRGVHCSMLHHHATQTVHVLLYGLHVTDVSCVCLIGCSALVVAFRNLLVIN